MDEATLELTVWRSTARFHARRARLYRARFNALAFAYVLAAVLL